MAILRSFDGTFYDVPDGEADKYKVPPDQVKDLMDAAGQKLQQNPGQQQTGQGAGQAQHGVPQILVQFITAAGPAGKGLGAQQGAQQAAPQGAEEEKVEAQWWVNWFNWANWYNYY